MANWKLPIALVAGLVMLGGTSQAARRGVDVTAGAGVSAFSQDLGPITNAGIGYGLRAGFFPFQAVGLELAYNGGVNNLQIVQENLVSNQLNADLRLGLQLARVSPYVFGGVGGYLLSAPEEAEAIGFDDGVAVTIPWGGGLAFDLGQDFTMEARYQYNILLDEKNRFGGRNADFWTATFNLGGVFGED